MGAPKDTPARLAAAAAAIANARGGRRGAPQIANILEMLPHKLLEEVLEDARVALDAAHAADPIIPPDRSDPAAERIHLAARIGVDLEAQAVVLIDVARDGTITGSTWAAQPGTPSEAIAEWTRGLTAHAISLVPFQTAFGWGCGGTPTPLTAEQLTSLNDAGRAYAARATAAEGR